MALDIARSNCEVAVVPASTAASASRSSSGAEPQAHASFGALLASIDDAPVGEPPCAVPASASTPADAKEDPDASDGAIATLPVPVPVVDPSALLLAQSAFNSVAATPVLVATALSGAGQGAAAPVPEPSRFVAPDLQRAPAPNDPIAALRPPLSRAVAAAEAAPVARAGAAAIEAAAAMPALATAIASETQMPWRRIEPRVLELPAAHAGLASGVDTALAASPFITAPDAAGASAGGSSAGGSGAGSIERMVEQVSWWMAHRSQGAELKLELPGGAPVSVTVQVQGNEAQVAFRSDHPEARQWLAAAMPELEAMLGNQGLMLSGASVGSSGSGAEQEAAREAQRALRAGAAATPAVDEPPAAPGTRPRSVSERALDLYV